MSQTKNQVSSFAPDPAGSQFLNDARTAARDAYQSTLNTPIYAGPRTAGIDPLQMQGVAQSQRMANLFGPAARMLMSQGQDYGGAADYFASQMRNGVGGMGQQYDVAMSGGPARAALEAQLAPGQSALSDITRYGSSAAAQGLDAATSALTDTPDVEAFMNPYRGQVLDAVQQQFGNVRNLTNRNISDRATAAGAFGGSREAVTRGAALADIARNETGQLAELTRQGYMDAANRATAQQQRRGAMGQSLFGQGINALGLQAGYGQQNANTLFGSANAAGQFLGTQGSYGANQQGQFGSNAIGSLFNAGTQGGSALGQYGTLFQGQQQAGLDRDANAADSGIQRRQQALNMLFGVGVPQGGTTSSNPMTRNYLAEGLGYVSAIDGLFGGNGIQSWFGGGNNPASGGGTTSNPFDLSGATYSPYQSIPYNLGIPYGNR